MSSFFQDDGEAGQPKICLATTVYEDLSPAYTFSLQRSREALHKAGFKTAYYLLSGNCHVDDARNSIVQEFLLSDCTDLVFLDSDVSWEPESLVRLCKYDADVVGGIYPYRRDNESEDKLPLVMFPGEDTPDENGLVNVAGIPTGFMRIRRHVLESLYKDADKFWNKTDRRLQIPIIFERTYFDGMRLGGDLSFCKKWILKGGLVHAASDLVLGHTAGSIIYDSLGAHLRRNKGDTLKYLVGQVRDVGFAPQAFAEARKYIGNKWGALEDVLSLCSLMGKKADGPIIESGSGLTSVVLAASTKEAVFSLENSPFWAGRVEGLMKEAGLSNHRVLLCPIKDGWYDISKIKLPGEFSLGLNDGPSRKEGRRMGFFERFGNTENIICDDADDPSYAEKLSEWCGTKGRRIDFVQRAAVIRTI